MTRDALRIALLAVTLSSAVTVPPTLSLPPTVSVAPEAQAAVKNALDQESLQVRPSESKTGERTVKESRLRQVLMLWLLAAQSGR